MDGTGIGNRRGVGSVKAAGNLYDDRISGTDGPSLKKTQMEDSVVCLELREHKNPSSCICYLCTAVVAFFY